MIGKLKGVVDEIAEDHVVIDVQGVGYVAHCPVGALSSLKSGENAVLFIETHVREDMIRLYGFRSTIEREWFSLLQGNVQGVGAKVALSVLSTLSTDELANAIAFKDPAPVTRAPGVGKKVAERIVSELQNKIPAGHAGPGSTPATTPVGREAADAVTALTNLGYAKEKASAAIAAAVKELGEGADSAALIKAGLKAAAH